MRKPLLFAASLVLMLAGWLSSGMWGNKAPENPFPSWQEVPAVVLSSTVTRLNQVSQVSNRRPSTFATWRLDLAFAYEAAGQTRISLTAAPHRVRTLLLFGGDGQPAPELLELQSRFPVGAVAMAHVNPKNPDEAYLLYWPSLQSRVLGWLALGAGALLLGYLALRR
jgi:hypothetical protein